MFASRYFADRYFAPHYWPKVGLTAVLLEATGEGLAWVPGRQRAAWVRGHLRSATVPGYARVGVVRGHQHSVTVPSGERRA